MTDFAEMDEGKGQAVRCAWDGDLSTWVDYIRKVRLTYERTRHRKRKYLGPELAAQLTGRAWVVTQEVDHRRLIPKMGRFLINFLEERLGRVPVPDAGDQSRGTVCENAETSRNDNGTIRSVRPTEGFNEP